MQNKEMTFADVEKLPEYLQYLHMIPNSVQSYDFLRKIAFAIKGCGGEIRELKDWMALYKKDKKKERRREMVKH